MKKILLFAVAINFLFTYSSNAFDFSMSDTIKTLPFFGDNNSTTKELKNQSSVALMCNDIKCENLIEPYDYTGNIISMATLIAKVETKAFFTTGTSNEQKLQLYKNGLKQLNWLPHFMEIELGNKLHEQRADVLPNKGKNIKYYKKAENLLKAITANLKDSPYEFKIYLIRGSSKDAQALPGGKIYITKSFLKDPKNIGYAKMTIGHEIAHTLKRHYTMEYQTLVVDAIDNIDIIKSMISNIEKSSKDTQENKYKEIYKKISSAATTKEFLISIPRNFIKNQEIEADSCAMKLLTNDQNLIKITSNFYDGLSKSSSKKDRGLLDFSINNHPSSQERLDNINERLQELK